MPSALSRTEFEAQLRAKGAYYHIYHPYHVAMNRGECTREQIQGWVANRFYYQVTIPRKDAAILSNCPDQHVRRHWIQRIIDHDGRDGQEGGIEAWLRLGEACGLTREELWSFKHLLPGVRFAVDAYLHFAQQATWQEAACSSLTELFAPEIHQKRLDTWPNHYTWIESSGLQYFRNRLSEARRDVQQGLQITLDYFQTYEQQMHALSILQFKLEILWTMLDAMQMAYVLKMPPFFTVEKPV
ncbi:pyrroloquinoline-quinone synthase PqqC [Thioflexithrix psekupsensis]|uniref:Pyrroloquinoline-quinone synthase n=1 Tax=Thioflexithrix psekupsensis TaxID=1570016 RepID=A0A251X338_9GAMM|nr:pyrroloquinoline-quinone synthase PqqC [Thioflexithrix psekupsensis]OUD11695.1 pyrroloquinoline quinone biosynthesis protein PqqC [Thioflexithrix psekupsensis]